jgi:phosphoribosylamine--glycine ligase
VVVGPEGPLADGVADQLEAAGVPTAGPSAAAAQLEASKTYTKDFLRRHSLPTAASESFDQPAPAHAYVQGPCVVKADGLAAGKGVYVCDNADQAHQAIDALLLEGRQGDAGARILIEERLSGPEVSCLALCDGERAVPLIPARDHKRRFDGDQGPNTGGMGAFAPVPGLSSAFIPDIYRTILQPTVDGMAAEGTPFRGVLYAGMMLTPDGPKVLEYNVRFGDPECQPLMLMLAEDLLPWLHGAATGKLPDGGLTWHPGSACCVVMVAGGYPGSVLKGAPIYGIPSPAPDRVVFQAGTRREGSSVVSNGGRVLGVTARGADLRDARQRAYNLCETIRFKTADYRRDIATSTLGEL